MSVPSFMAIHPVAVVDIPLKTTNIKPNTGTSGTVQGSLKSLGLILLGQQIYLQNFMAIQSNSGDIGSKWGTLVSLEPSH